MSLPAYLIGRVEISDPERFKQYTAKTPAIIEKFGGRFLVRGGLRETLEGPAETLRTVILEFPSVEHARGFYHSPEYQAAKKLREGAGSIQFVLVEGYGA